MNIAKQKQNNRQRGLRETMYQVNDVEYVHPEAKQDTYTQGELAKAAAVLMEHAAKQQATRSLVDAAKDYDAYKKDEWRDLDRAGYQPATATPPEGWPFTEAEWALAISYGYYRTLNRANAYLTLENERVARWNQSMRRHGVAGLDNEARTQLDKTEERGRKFNARRWHNVNEGMSIPVVNSLNQTLVEPAPWYNVTSPSFTASAPHPNSIPLEYKDMEGQEDDCVFNDEDGDY